MNTNFLALDYRNIGFLNAGNILFDNSINAVTQPIQQWLNNHPFLHWLVTHPLMWLIAHPLWLLGTILLILVGIVGLVNALGDLTRNLWISLFRLPLWIGRSLTAGLMALIERSGLLNQLPRLALGNPQQPPPKIKLEKAIARLEALKQEQEELLQEVKSLLGHL